MTKRKGVAGTKLTKRKGVAGYVCGCWNFDRAEWEVVCAGFGRPHWSGKTTSDLRQAYRWRSRQAAHQYLKTGEHRRPRCDFCVINLAWLTSGEDGRSLEMVVTGWNREKTASLEPICGPAEPSVDYRVDQIQGSAVR